MKRKHTDLDRFLCKGPTGCGNFFWINPRNGLPKSCPYCGIKTLPGFYDPPAQLPPEVFSKSEAAIWIVVLAGFFLVLLALIVHSAPPARVTPPTVTSTDTSVHIYLEYSEDGEHWHSIELTKEQEDALRHGKDGEVFEPMVRFSSR